MKKDEFRKLQIGDSVYSVTHIGIEIPLVEFIVMGKTENEILVKLKEVSSKYTHPSKDDFKAITPFKYKLLFANKNMAINDGLERLERRKQELIALLE